MQLSTTQLRSARLSTFGATADLSRPARRRVPPRSGAVRVTGMRGVIQRVRTASVTVGGTAQARFPGTCAKDCFSQGLLACRWTAAQSRASALAYCAWWVSGLATARRTRTTCACDCAAAPSLRWRLPKTHSSGCCAGAGRCCTQSCGLTQTRGEPGARACGLEKRSGFALSSLTNNKDRGA